LLDQDGTLYIGLLCLSLVFKNQISFGKG
jgi:hypothetical protein